MDLWLILSLVLRVGSLLASFVLLARTRTIGTAWVSLALALAVLRQVQQWSTIRQVDIAPVLTVSIICVVGTVTAFRTIAAHASQKEQIRLAGEKRYQRIIQSVQANIWSVDLAGRTTFVNASLARLLGYEPSEMMGAHMARFVAEPDAGQLRTLFSKPLKVPVEQQTVLKTKDGRSVFTQLCISPLIDEQEHMEGSIATLTNVTERRKAEQVARWGNRLLEKFVGGAPLTEQLNTLCLTVEESLSDVHCGVMIPGDAGRLSLRAGPSLSPALRSLIDEASRRSRGDFLGSAAQDRAPFHVEDASTHPAFRGCRKLAERCEVAASWTIPIQSGLGAETIGLLTCLRSKRGLPSLEEQKALETYAKLACVAIHQMRTKEELEQALEQLRLAIHQSPAGILIADAETGRVQVANSRALGVTAGAPINVSQLEADQLPIGWVYCQLDGTPIAREELPLVRAIEGGHTSRNVEFLLKREDGLKRWVLASAGPVRCAAGQVRGALMVSLDISERKREERDLQRLLKSLGSKTEELEQLFRATNHDLRAPLVNVEGFSQELAHGLDEMARLLATADLDVKTRNALQHLLDDELRSAQQHITTSAGRMDHLMKGMARLNAIDRHMLSTRDLDTGSLVREVLRAFEFRVRDEGAEVEVGELPCCTGDHTQLGQVFANLIDNAIKFRHPERPLRLSIRGRRSGDRVHIELEDNGIGIPSADRERIFRPFFRSPASAQLPGDGLGLAILSRIVTRMDGRIQASHGSEGGSRFELELPAGTRAEEQTAAEETGTTV